jgi:hypothetical protein
MVIKELVWRR